MLITSPRRILLIILTGWFVMLLTGLVGGYASTATVRSDYAGGEWCVHFKHFMVCSQPAGSDGLYGNGGY